MYKKSIIYLNYSPYENSGHILDYLLENFERVYLFSIAFHTLGNKQPLNKLSFYKNGKLVKEEFLFYMRIPQRLVFFLIPIRSTMNAFQIVQKIFQIKKEIGIVDVYFTVNAFTATIGRLLKKIGVVRETIFWVWDYYPTENTSWSVGFMRWLYWQFDKFATFSDRVFYLHPRLADVRREAGLISKSKKTVVIPIGTGEALPLKKKNLSKIKLGFIGVLKKSQGVDMLLDGATIYAKYIKNLTFEIIGSGPDEALFKKKAKKARGVAYNFYGYVSDDEFKKILYGCTIGVAPYMPDSSNVSKYTDPGKPKRYIEFNLPNITTDVIEFSNEIKANKAGEVIKYGDYDGFVKAIKRIVDNYDRYVKSTLKIHQKYYYRNLYPMMFGLRKSN